MSNPAILEKSLDEIIGSSKDTKRRSRGPRGGRDRNRVGKDDGRRPRGGPSKIIPLEVAERANGKPLLRVKNIHPELSGEDLKNLFEQVGGVDFITFDKKNDSIAYVLFFRDQSRNNLRAISKFNGRQAMGRTLSVESSLSLADRISVGGGGRGRGGPVRERERGQQHPAKAKSAKPAKEKPVKKSVEELDDELSAYMAQSAGASTTTDLASAEVGVTESTAPEDSME